jgi:hypothetical protein
MERMRGPCVEGTSVTASSSKTKDPAGRHAPPTLLEIWWHEGTALDPEIASDRRHARQALPFESRRWFLQISFIRYTDTLYTRYSEAKTRWQGLGLGRLEFRTNFSR